MSFFNKNKISSSLDKNEIKNYKINFGYKNSACYAPSNALYFHPDGQITACCLNKNIFYYGYYPQYSIKEILESTPRKLHQKYLSAFNFELGCKACLENFKAGNYSGTMAQIYANFKSKKIQRMDFELSHFCNLDCVMCFRDKCAKKNQIYSDNFFNEIKSLLKNLKFYLRRFHNCHNIAKERKLKLSIISKNDLANTFSKINNNYKVISQKILDICPNIWFVNKLKYNEILNTDFNSKIYELKIKGIKDDEIVNIAKNFFEIYRCENL